MARLYDPVRGTVELDGVDLKDLSFESLARALGFVTQESYLFAGSLRNNIAYARPDATIEEVEKAARAIAIDDRIMEFEDGDPKVLILDVDHGSIVESGSPDALRAADGAYAKLYRQQFGAGSIETTTNESTVNADGRCEYFASSHS